MPKFREIVQAFVGVFIIISATGYFFAISFDFIPHNDANISAILPIFNTTLATAVGFYLGGSLSSKAKDETINTLTGSSTSANVSKEKTELTVTKTEPEKP